MLQPHKFRPKPDNTRLQEEPERLSIFLTFFVRFNSLPPANTGREMTGSEKDREQRRAGSESGPPARVPIEAILKGAKEIIIVHNGDDYRLRVTARGKLILTK